MSEGLSAHYRDVAPAWRERLLAFRDRFPSRRVVVGGSQWTFLDSETGEAPVLALTGATCVAEASWLTIDHLAKRWRVVAPDYPPLDSLPRLADGIVHLLDELGLAAVYVVGGLYGGFVAQVVARRHPARTRSLVLSHSFLPDPGSTARWRRVARALRLIPESWLRVIFRRRLGRLFSDEDLPEVAVSRAMFEEALEGRLTKAHIVAMIAQLADPSLRPLFAPDAPGYRGPTLLLLARDDPATPEETRDALIAAYPGAEVRLFSGSGHLTAVLQRDAYTEAIDAFLEEANAR